MAIASDMFTSIDLSRLPAPAVVETLDFEAIYAALLAEFQVFFPSFDATVESDPVVKILQLVAYREMLWRQRVNDAARAVMPAYAVGADLDNLAALFGIVRLVIDAGDEEEGIAPTLESDADFRRRMGLAPEGFSVAGPAGAYIFHTLSADPEVRDASVDSPDPGEVLVTVLSRSGDGTADADLLAAVDAKLNGEAIRPLTDAVTVQSASIQNFAIVASLKFLSGPDRSVVMAEAQARLTRYLDNLLLGRDVTRAGIIAALYAEGVQNVTLTAPAADIPITRQQAAHCTAVTVTDAGVGE